MKHTIHFTCLFFCSFLLFSCDKKLVDPTQKSTNSSFNQAISISEAQNYVNRLKSKSRKSSSSDSTLNFVWDNARQSILKDGKSIVITPVNYNKSSRISSLNGNILTEETKAKNLISDKFLFYKNDNGDVRSVLVTVIPDETYRSEKNGQIRGNDFSGFVLVSNPETEEVITAWVYKNGKDIKQVVARSKKAVANARLSTCAESVVDVYERQDPNSPSQVGGGDNSPGTSITIGDVVYVKTGTKTFEMGDCASGENVAVPGATTTPSVGEYNWNGNYSTGTAPSPFGDATMDDYDNFGRYIGSDPYYIAIQGINDLDAMGFGSTPQERELLLQTPRILQRLRQFMNEVTNNLTVPNLIQDLNARIGQLQPEERQKLGEGGWVYRINLAMYAANAYGAEQTTRYYFPNGNDFLCPECKANAFKHALFRMYDSDVFGSVRALELGVAHEAVAFRNTLASKMDLRNNSMGIYLYIAAGQQDLSAKTNMLWTLFNSPKTPLCYIRHTSTGDVLSAIDDSLIYQE